MRFIGPYGNGEWPTYDVLVAASTEGRRDALGALARKVATGAARYQAALPDVHAVHAVKLSKAQKATLVDGYEGRSLAIVRLLEAMHESTPEANRDLCPYCSLDTTYQLDHFLPKSVHPEFSLYAPNLLPICGRCNQIKSNSIVDAAGLRAFLLPSADAFLPEGLLFASLTIEPSPRFSFAIDPAAAVSPAALLQARRHFDRLQLAKRYRRRANSLLVPLKTAAARAGGSRRNAARIVIDGLRSSHAEGPRNGWRLAMFRAVLHERHRFIDWLIAGP